MSQTDLIKRLRDETGISFSDIKKALDDAGGDEAKAMEALKAKGAAMAEKRATREVKEGVIASYVHANKKLAAVVELLCETDFVARTDDFRNIANDIAMHIAAMKPQNMDELMTQVFVKDGSITIQDLVNQSVAKIGENIKIGNFQVFEI